MIRNYLMLGFSAAALALSGCNQPERSPMRSETKGPSGSARIALPDIPAGYLPDSGSKAWFSLTITGAGMDPILKTWSLKGAGGTDAPVLVEGIPAGMRSFRGRLIRIDSGKRDTTVTHEGVDSAFIVGDSVAEVRLYLKAAGLGAAKVCVEVEGWPADSACIAPPSPLPDVAGCYAITVDKPGPKDSRQDTLFRGRLRLTQSGGNLKATLDRGNGRMEKADGQVGNDGVIDFEAGGDFILKGHPDSSGFWGFFTDSSHGISGSLRLDAESCDAPILPDTVVASLPGQRACYSFTEIHFNPADTVPGTLALEQRAGQSGVDVYLRLDGLGFFATQTAYSAGILGDESWVGFRIAPPPGMFGSVPVQEISYDLHLLPSGVSSSPIMETFPAPGTVGTWRGQSRACLEGDFRK